MSASQFLGYLTAGLFAIHLGPPSGSNVSAQQPSFEAAVVKRNVSGDPGASFGGTPGRIVVSNNTLFNIIRNTWRLQPFQIVGGPDWINKDRWDITAKAPEGTLAPRDMLLMMRTLLAEHFKLVVHDEAREMPVFALVLARFDGKFGPQFRRSEVDCAAIFSAVERGAPPPRAPGQPTCGQTSVGAGTVKASGVLLADFARNLSGRAERIILDRTGLSGYFDIDLKYAPDQLGPDSPDRVGDGAPSLFAAIQEQLGLKLEAQRLPVDVLVIDSADRPTN